MRQQIADKFIEWLARGARGKILNRTEGLGKPDGYITYEFMYVCVFVSDIYCLRTGGASENRLDKQFRRKKTNALNVSIFFITFEVSVSGFRCVIHQYASSSIVGLLVWPYGNTTLSHTWVVAYQIRCDKIRKASKHLLALLFTFGSNSNVVCLVA